MASSIRSNNSFGAWGELQLGERRFSVYRLDHLAEREGFDVAHLPFSLKVLLENLLRHEDDLNVTPESIAALELYIASFADSSGPSISATDSTYGAGQTTTTQPPGRGLGRRAIPVVRSADSGSRRDYFFSPAPPSPSSARRRVPD